MSSKYVDIYYDIHTRELRTPSGVVGKIKVRDLEVTSSLNAGSGSYSPNISVAGATLFETYVPHYYFRNNDLVTVSGQCSVTNITGGAAGQLDITVDLPFTAVRTSLNHALHGACTAWMTDSSAPASSQTYPGFVELDFTGYPNCTKFHALVHWNRDGTFTTAPTVDSGGRISWQFTYDVSS